MHIDPVNPREPFERLLDVFNSSFQTIAKEEGFVFDPRTGHVGRALRLKSDPMKRGVFLDLKNHWMESDPVDPEVVLQFGAWSTSHVLFKKFYEGKLSGLIPCINDKLKLAASELKAVSSALIAQKGVPLDDLLKGKATL